MEQTNRPINVRSLYARDVLTFTFGLFRLHVPERSLQRHGVSVPLGAVNVAEQLLATPNTRHTPI
jgi:hypothetical protein